MRQSQRDRRWSVCVLDPGESFESKGPPSLFFFFLGSRVTDEDSATQKVNSGLLSKVKSSTKTDRKVPGACALSRLLLLREH